MGYRYQCKIKDLLVVKNMSFDHAFRKYGGAQVKILVYYTRPCTRHAVKYLMTHYLYLQQSLVFFGVKTHVQYNCISAAIAMAMADSIATVHVCILRKGAWRAISFQFFCLFFKGTLIAGLMRGPPTQKVAKISLYRLYAESKSVLKAK